MNSTLEDLKELFGPDCLSIKRFDYDKSCGIAARIVNKGRSNRRAMQISVNRDISTEVYVDLFWWRMDLYFRGIKHDGSVAGEYQ